MNLKYEDKKWKVYQKKVVWVYLWPTKSLLKDGLLTRTHKVYFVL